MSDRASSNIRADVEDVARYVLDCHEWCEHRTADGQICQTYAAWQPGTCPTCKQNLAKKVIGGLCEGCKQKARLAKALGVPNV